MGLTKRRGIVFVLGGIGGLLICAVVTTALWQQDAPHAIEDPSVSKTVSTGQRLQPLLDIPPFVLTDQSAAPFGTPDLDGRVWVANFIFTRCQGTCPQQTAQLIDLQAQLEKASYGDQVHLVSISVDPEYDTPQVLREYANAVGANSAHWSFLTGERQEVWTLSKVGFKLGVGDQPSVASSPIFHSDKLILVDRQLRVRGLYEGTKESGIIAVLKDIETLIAEPALVKNPVSETAGSQRPPGPAPSAIYVPDDVPFGVNEVWAEEGASGHKSNSVDLNVYKVSSQKLIDNLDQIIKLFLETIPRN